MDSEFVFDENGKISDNDKIYDKLIAWHENEKK